VLIAATAIAEGLPLFTTKTGDFTGLDTLQAVMPVTHLAVPHETTIRAAVADRSRT
jgi:hypothetical protein